jgi:hypothetical protein
MQVVVNSFLVVKVQVRSRGSIISPSVLLLIVSGFKTDCGSGGNCPAIQ